MATKRTDGPRPRMIHCEYCGEDYASTYKHCPFCDEIDAGEEYYEGEEEPRSQGGGRRLADNRSGNSRGGGYGGGPSLLNILFIVISLALIIAAVMIVITIVRPLLGKGNSTTPTPTPPGIESPVPPTPDIVPTGVPGGASSTGVPGGAASPTVDPNSGSGGAATPLPTPATPAPSTPTPAQPAGNTATDFSLNKSEFTLSDQWPDPVTLKVTYTPSGSTGSVTWSSSHPDIVSVDANGTVSPGSKRGTVTITATLPSGVSHTCTVHNAVTGGSSGSGASGGSASSTSNPTLNRSDFTLAPGESWKVEVSGNTGTPEWSIANPAVATVAQDGTVTYAGPGATTLTCTVDGKTLHCTVRGKN